MAITRAEVAHVARLARLALTEEELAQFERQLGQILDVAAAVAALPTEDVPPTSHALGLVNVWREDVLVPCLRQDEALSTAPATDQGRFTVPRIIEEEA